MTIYEFFVPGIPAPGGSKSPFVVKGRAIMSPASKHTRPWMDSVRSAGMEAKGRENRLLLLTIGLRLDVTFLMPRPKAHYKADGTIKPSADTMHTKKPDRTKLLRSTEDALTGILWLDDAQVCCGEIVKRYVREGEVPGAEIAVSPWSLR